MTDGVALSVHLRRRTWAAAAAAHLCGAAVVATYLLLLAPGSLPGDFHWGEMATLVAALLGLGLPVGDALASRLSGPGQEALAAGRPLDESERAALARIPSRGALVSMGVWAIGAIAIGAYDGLRIGDDVRGAAATGLTVLLGGLTTSAVVFLLLERVLRPVYEFVFRSAPPQRAEGVGVARRLILAWVLVGAVPALAIGLAVAEAGGDPSESDYDDLVGAVVALIAITLLAGLLITFRIARSLGTPLGALRGAVDRIRHGDLEAEVAVDDATEIGVLQAGFNEMVTGLRERARLEDLFGRHVGPEVAREALERGVQLGGERRAVSVLFLDIAGSTRLAAEHPPEEVVELLNAVFGAVVRIAAEEEGWVDKFDGDAALCVFGAPVDQPDHAPRALRAGRRLRAAVEQLRTRYPRLDVGIGIAGGVVVAGNIGAEQRHEYTVIGDPVNEAARLTEEAKSAASRVLASGTVVDAAGGEAERWRRAGELSLRGRLDHTQVFEPDASAPEDAPPP